MANDQTLIGHLRVAGVGLDPLLTRQRASYLLNAIAVQPADLPPAAILCVRTLRDPSPGTLDLSGAQIAPARAWGRAVVESLDRAAQHAYRPLQGGVPSTAQAVLFVDRAEMLASLTLDYQQGQVLNRWWWRQVLRMREVRAAVVGAWLETPEHAPAALAHVSARGDVVAWVRSLSGSEVRYLTQTIVERFGLRELADLLRTVDEAGADAHAAALSGSPTPSSIAAASPPPGQALPSADASGQTETSVSAPWADRVPAHATTLSPLRQALLGISLSLVYIRSTVRTSGFAWRVADWLNSPLATGDDRLPGPGIDAHLPGPPEAASPPPASADLVGWLPQEASPHDRPGVMDAPPDTLGADFPAEPADIAPLLSAQVSDTASALNASPRQEPLRELIPELEVSTELGGLFYLINVGLSLGLYGDFTTPLAPGIDLSIWDFLALVGEVYLGEELRQDPLWPLLASLSGRGSGDPPGGGFAPPPGWRAPAEWPNFFDPVSCDWAVSQGRLRVWHPAGFWLLDLAANKQPSRQLARALPALSGRLTRSPDVPSPRQGALDAWVDWWSAYIRARLCVMLGLDDPADLSATLLRYQARLVFSSARLDIMLRLDDLALAVRLAGLDRDPAWVPAAGRWIAFHFD